MDLLGMHSLALRVAYCTQVFIEGRREYTICDNKKIKFMTCIAGGKNINCLMEPFDSDIKCMPCIAGGGDQLPHGALHPPRPDLRAQPRSQ